jgi:carboxyl-terminal processing protease
MYPTVNDPSEGLWEKRSHWVKALFVLILGLFLTLGSPHSATALSDTQQLVVDSWRLVNQGYLDPDHLDAVRWRRQRQKAMEKSIVSSEDAYGAIEGMLSALDDPYTRLLRPAAIVAFGR